MTPLQNKPYRKTISRQSYRTERPQTLRSIRDRNLSRFSDRRNQTLDFVTEVDKHIGSLNRILRDYQTHLFTDFTSKFKYHLDKLSELSGVAYYKSYDSSSQRKPLNRRVRSSYSLEEQRFINDALKVNLSELELSDVSQPNQTKTPDYWQSVEPPKYVDNSNLKIWNYAIQRATNDFSKPASWRTVVAIFKAKLNKEGYPCPFKAKSTVSDELVDREIDGKKIKVKELKNSEEAKKFLDENPGFSAVDEENGKIYAAINV